MFKNFISKLKAKLNRDAETEVRQKWEAVKQALTRKYEAEDLRSNGVNLPVFTRVNQEMDKIRTRKTLDNYYERYVKRKKTR